MVFFLTMDEYKHGYQKMFKFNACHNTKNTVLFFIIKPTISIRQRYQIQP